MMENGRELRGFIFIHMNIIHSIEKSKPFRGEMVWIAVPLNADRPIIEINKTVIQANRMRTMK